MEVESSESEWKAFAALLGVFALLTALAAATAYVVAVCGAEVVAAGF